jgi:hypothetical protein
MQVPPDPAQAALRSLIRRVVGFFVAGIVVIALFAIAWWLGAFSPSRPGAARGGGANVYGQAADDAIARSASPPQAMKQVAPGSHSSLHDPAHRARHTASDSQRISLPAPSAPVQSL